MTTEFGISERALEDHHPEWLNTLSGTIDLRSGLVKPWDPADMITYCLDARVQAGAPCPLFWNLVLRACGGKQHIAEYLVKVLGYSMLGENPEQLIFFLQGPTASGKTALLNVVTRLLGPLAHNSTSELIMVTKNGRNARSENSIRGRRLVTITETSGWLVIEEAQLKRLTGDRDISVDRHYALEQLPTVVSWLIIVATNEMPVLANPDGAIHRRVMIIPMGQTIPEHERDLHLTDRILAEERDGVLSLLAWGAHEVLSGRFEPPVEVRIASDSYWWRQDTVGRFLAEFTTYPVQQSLNGQGPRVFASQHATWEAYRLFTKDGPRLPKQEFKPKLVTMPGIHADDNQRRYEGFELTPEVLAMVL